MAKNPSEPSTSKNKITRLAIIFLVAGNFLVWSMTAVKTENLRVTFFDVGQGDAAFIQTPNANQILIDGGPGHSVLDKLGQAMPFWDKDIDLVILTHPDRDHLAGLLAVLDTYNVKKVIWSGISSDSPEAKEWIAKIGAKNCDAETATDKEKFSIDGNAANFIEVLAPGAAGSSGNKNENSLVARLQYGQRSFLFTGDITSQEGEDLEKNNQNIGADVLKVAHHGSQYSTDDLFLANLLPAAAVISVGNNSYGHPAPEVLEMLGKYDIKTLRTDQNGDITFETDGQTLFVKTEK